MPDPGALRLRPVRAAALLRRAAVAGSLLALAGTCAADAQVTGPALPANDFGSTLALASGQAVPSGPATVIPHPVLAPVPRARCGPGSEPLDDPIQGRVSAADVAAEQASRGWTCNVTRVGRSEIPGGFRVWRYEDRNGHVCAFYDSSLGSPANVVSLAAAPTQGVVVLDMTDPTHPVRTDLLVTPGMLSPHESLNLNAGRGLLAAETGTAGTTAGSLDIYDAAADCRHPTLQSVTPTRFGHESGFSPDGRTFWVAGGGGSITAFDVTNPKLPFAVWEGNLYSHGLNFSDDGRTLFQTDPINGNLGILDVSEVQARRPSPQIRQISRVTWDTVSIPQNSVPLTIAGHPYLLEFDEFAFRFNPATVDDRAGAARLLDIADLAHPTVASDLRLEVNMPDVHRRVHDDPYPLNVQALGYGGHYCAVPTQVDPEIVACSFLNSGLRVFDIRDPEHPRESAYFVSPPKEGAAPGQEGDFAFSQPAFDVRRHDVWYSDATSGFYVLHLDDAAWPARATAKACVSKRNITIRLPRPLRAATVLYAGRRARAVRGHGRLIAHLDLRGLPARTVVVRVRGRTRSGRTLTQTRRFRTCRRRV